MNPPPGLWFLVVGGKPLLLDMPGGLLAPCFPTSDTARQFMGFAGLDGDTGFYPAQPSRLQWWAWQAYCRGRRCSGLVLIAGVHPWQAVAVDTAGRRTPIAEPAAVLV